MPYLGIFDLNFLKTIIICEINILVFALLQSFVQK